MSGSDDGKSPLERLLEVGVYAPLGFLVTRSQTVPDLAKAGRRQIAFARSLGKAALNGLVRSVRRDAPAPSRSPARPPAPVGEDTTEVPDAVDEAAAGSSVVDEAAAGSSVAGYDAMTAKEVIELVKSADRSTLQWIRTYESTHKDRVTVARAVTKALG